MFGTDHAKGIPTATNVDQVGITVPDLQQAVTFFTDVLGRIIWPLAGLHHGPEDDGSDRRWQRH